MHLRVRAALAAGRGLVSSRRLAALGVDPRELRRWVAVGDLVAVRRGVYADGATWAAWNVYVERPLARVRAAALTLAVPHVFSHDSAALLHGLPLIRPWDAAVHVTRPRVVGSRHHHGVHHHPAPYLLEQVTVVDALRALDVPRTVADLARQHGLDTAVVAADAALRQGWKRDDLAITVEAMAGWPGVTTAREAVDLADPGAENGGETLARMLVIEIGAGRPETQFPVLLRSGGVAYCDLRVGRHVFEFDGRVKFLSPDAGGVAARTADEVWDDERRRQLEVCREGLGMSRISYEDLWGDRRRRALERLTMEYAESVRRFGTELTPEMATFAAAHRRTHARVRPA